MSFDEQAEALGVEISHFFVGDEYAKLTKIPAGCKLTQHVHKFDHCSSLLIGKVLIEVDGHMRTCVAPCSLTIEAGKAHEVTALMPTLWACLWDNPDSETDPAKMDEAVTA